MQGEDMRNLDTRKESIRHLCKAREEVPGRQLRVVWVAKP